MIIGVRIISVAGIVQDFHQDLSTSYAVHKFLGCAFKITATNPSITEGLRYNICSLCMLQPYFLLWHTAMLCKQETYSVDVWGQIVLAYLRVANNLASINTAWNRLVKWVKMCLKLCSLSSECYKFLLGNVRTSEHTYLLGLHILLIT
jgi:hypothetical protein